MNCLSLRGLVSVLLPLCLAWSLGCGPGPTGGAVHGSVHVLVGGEGKAEERLALPDLKLFLRDSKTRKEVATVETDLFGRYYFPKQAPGTYALGWHSQSGWEGGTHPDPVVVVSDTEFPQPAEIRQAKSSGVLYGRLTLADGSPTWFQDAFFATENTGNVSVLDLPRVNTLGGPVRANAYGYYAVAGLPSGVDVVVRAQSQSESLTRTVGAASIATSNPSNPVDLELGNFRPELLAVVADAGSGVTKTAPPGTVLQLSAVLRDLDTDPLLLDWGVQPGHGSIAGAGDTKALWTLPNATGIHSAHLLVSDGKGGFARTRLDFDIAKTDETFSGRVVDLGGAPVQGAEVSANGKLTLSSANGYFSVATPLSKRYVLNIKKTGFALFSRVVDAGATGQTWTLVNAQVDTVDPTQVITIVDDPAKRNPREGKQQRGVRITIPANALVDASGKAPAGLLTAYTATYDISDGQAPGDWGGLVDGKETNLISFGAGWLELRDSAGTLFNLAAGQTAEIETPTAASQIPGAPPNVPMWSYDEADGYWKRSGEAALDLAKGSFVGKVSHFSAFNTDLALDEAACLKVLLYPPLPTGVTLRMTDPTGTNFTQTFDFVLDRPLRGIYRVPANIDVRLQLFDADGNEYGNLVLEEVPGTALPGNLVDTGPPIPAGDTLWPEEPYETCKLVILRLEIETNPSVFLTLKPNINADTGAAYYAAVDPSSLRTTLGDWWSTNGFTLDAEGVPTNAVRTSYLNNNDLGSGRDMYFRSLGGGRVAAYVTNYGDFDQDHGNADLAATRTSPGATVCMEYAPVEGAGSTPIVKFFVYAGNGFGAEAVLQEEAELDGFGSKSVPALCTICHGGEYNPADIANPSITELNMGARFRELDYATYKFPGGRVVPNPGEKERFRLQNEIILGGGNSITTDAIRDLIAGWYPGASDDQDNNFTPSGWSGSPESGLYLDMVRNSCRTCHYAFDDDANSGGITWSTYDQLKLRVGSLDYYALCEQHPMPHAVVTFRNYWLSTSPHQPGALRNYSDGATWPLIGECD